MVSSADLYVALLVAVAAERVVELVISTRNARAAFAKGGVEHGRGHYPTMVVIHTGLLVGAAVEVVAFGRPFLPAVGWPALALVVGAQALRWWVIGTLGARWNTRVIVVPGGERAVNGPFRFLAHPNYLAVVVEGFALPMVHTAWVTALVFSVANAALLWVRIRVESAALQALRAPEGGR